MEDVHRHMQCIIDRDGTHLPLVLDRDGNISVISEDGRRHTARRVILLPRMYTSNMIVRAVEGGTGLGIGTVSAADVQELARKMFPHVVTDAYPWNERTCAVCVLLVRMLQGKYMAARIQGHM